MAVDFNFKDVDSFFNEGERELVKTLNKVGEEAVSYAKEKGSYKDRTGNLRRSNSYDVEDTSLIIKNTADYASDVESRGYIVSTSAALFAEKRLKEEIL